MKLFSLFTFLLAGTVLANPASNLQVFGTGDRGKVPKGFVTTKGTKFRLDNKDFAFVGSNSYWLPLLTTKEDVDLTLRDAAKAGIKVMRTWGFNGINATELPTALATNLTYYQVWNSSRFEINYGSQGLERLDYVVEAAERYNVKLIVAFTNDWSAYGGSDFYVQWIKGSATHDVFYSDPDIIAEYQRYVKIIVERYKDSPGIFAWELMNEARCLGDLPTGPNCPYKRLVSQWYSQQADYVRSLDPYHMIATGGEGHFFWDNPPTFWYNGTEHIDYNYSGEAGEDFDGDFKIANIDFATYHIYVDWWYPQLISEPNSNFSAYEWGLQWIQQHADAAKKGGKPVVLEEFGVASYEDKLARYPGWVQRALDTQHAGIMPWQYGQLGLTESGGNRVIKYADAIIDGASPNDSNTFYKNQTDIWNIFTRAAQIQNARSK